MSRLAKFYRNFIGLSNYAVCCGENKLHISLAFEIKRARSVVVMILDNAPSDRGSIPREVKSRNAKQAEELTKN